MSNIAVSGVYKFVMEDVIENMKREFDLMGVDEPVIQKLRQNWEAKMAQSRVANFTDLGLPLPFDSSDYPDDQSVRSSSQPTNMSSTLGGMDFGNTPAGMTGDIAAASLATIAGGRSLLQQEMDDGLGRPAQYMVPRGAQPYPTVLMLPRGGRSALHEDNLPQLDGADDPTRQPRLLAGNPSKKLNERNTATPGLAQLDGSDNHVGDEDAINSDLDDPEEDVNDEDSHFNNVDNIILCLYDKVTRTKNKWKCTLKDAIILVNGREYLCHKATGDFEW